MERNRPGKKDEVKRRDNEKNERESKGIGEKMTENQTKGKERN